MNLRYRVGRALDDVECFLLATFGGGLKRYPLGRQWPFDVVRFGGQPSTVIDAGANVGMTTLYMRQFFKTAVIHAFEPVQQVLPRVLQRTLGPVGVVAGEPGL